VPSVQSCAPLLFSRAVLQNPYRFAGSVRSRCCTHLARHHDLMNVVCVLCMQSWYAVLRTASVAGSLPRTGLSGVYAADGVLPFSKTYRVVPEHTTCLVPAAPGPVAPEPQDCGQRSPLHRRFASPSPRRGPPGELRGAGRATSGAGRTRRGCRRAAPLPRLPPTTVERSGSSIQLSPVRLRADLLGRVQRRAEHH
jgi:hypothetical protein